MTTLDKKELRESYLAHTLLGMINASVISKPTLKSIG